MCHVGGGLGNVSSENRYELGERNDCGTCDTYFVRKRNTTDDLVTWRRNDGRLENQISYIPPQKTLQKLGKRITNNTISNISTPARHRTVILDIGVPIKTN